MGSPDLEIPFNQVVVTLQGKALLKQQCVEWTTDNGQRTLTHFPCQAQHLSLLS